jgi:lysophospholipase L1-like esterase
MTVTTSVNKTQPLGNGVTTSFPYAFRIYAAADLVVVRTDIATGVDTPLVLNTDYTVTGVGSYNGGNVVFGVAPATGVRITIRRVVSITQQTDLRNNGAYFAETHEDVFDRLTMVDQQQQEVLDRSLTLAPTSSGVSAVLPNPVGSQALAWNPEGTALVNVGPVDNTLLAVQLADSADAAKGVTLIGYLGSTLRAYLNQFITSVGASLVGWIQSGAGAVLRLVQDKLRERVSVKDFGADSTGVANSSTAFSNAGNAASTVIVPDGTYLLNSDVTSSATYVLGAAVSFTGAGVLYAPVNRPYTSHYPGRKKTLADVLNKANAGTAITIACYGDSITYSQDTTATGTKVAINGASQTRSGKPYPDALLEAIGFAGFAGGVTVFNRGFPGDTTIEGITRWSAASATDVAFIMYGHNDANNYGGYAHGAVSLANFRRNMSMIIEREIVKGAVVILLGPPPVQDVAQNEKIRPYSAAAKQIAAEYGIQFIDVAEQLSPITSIWTDGVHLTTYAYHETGWHLAGLFLRRDGAIHRIARGAIYYAPDSLGHGGTYFASATAKGGSGALISLAAGQTYAIGAYVEEDCLPVIHSVNSTGVNFTLRSYYAGGNTGTSGVATADLLHNPTKGLRQKLIAPKLRRGYRTLFIRNDGATTAYIEAIEFAGAEFVTVSRGLQVKSSALSGIFQPVRQSVADTWFIAGDYSKKLTDPCNIIARMTLSDVGAGAANGVVLLGALPEAGALDLVCGNMLIVFRSGTSLILRQLINALPDPDTTVAAVFPAGVWTGEIELELTAGTMNVYVDGTLTGTRAVAQTSGYAGVIGAAAARFVCNSLWYSGYVKGPY